MLVDGANSRGDEYDGLFLRVVVVAIGIYVECVFFFVLFYECSFVRSGSEREIVPFFDVG